MWNPNLRWGPISGRSSTALGAVPDEEVAGTGDRRRDAKVARIDRRIRVPHCTTSGMLGISMVPSLFSPSPCRLWQGVLGLWNDEQKVWS